MEGFFVSLLRVHERMRLCKSVPEECLILLNLRSGHPLKISSSLKSAVPFDNPSERLLQRKNRMPIQADTCLRRVQLEGVSLSRMRCGILVP